MKSAQPLRYMDVKAQLLQQISSLQPHDRLPSRTVLSEKYQAARTTIERAISELIGEGVLYARDGSGTYVSEPDPRLPAERGVSPIKTWGLLIPDIQHYNYPDIVRGAGDVASDHDINLVICNTDNEYEKMTKHLHKLKDSRVQGVIIVPAIYGEADFSSLYALRERGIPFVFCHRNVSGIQAPSVISNHFHAGYIGTKHLIAAGCRRIAYLSRPIYSASSDRYQGYLCALSEANLPIRQDLVVFESDFESEGEGYDSALGLLNSSSRPDGLFCFNDRIARGAYRAAAQAGLAVGDEIRIVGCDNTDLCEALPVKLTSVKFRTYEMGRRAAELLLRAEYRENEMHVLQPELMVRDS